MAADLAQTQQGFEGGEYTAAGIEKCHDIGQCGSAHRVIDDAFTVAEHAVQDDIGAWRQFGGHLALAPPQQRLYFFPEMGCHAGLASSNGALVAFLKNLTSTEQPTIQKVQLTPEFIEPILDRCPGQSQTKVGP